MSRPTDNSAEVWVVSKALFYRAPALFDKGKKTKLFAELMKKTRSALRII